MYASATIERRMPRRLLFGAAIVVLNSARLTPSSDLASASKRATWRIAERANDPSAASVLSLARRWIDVRRTLWVLNGRNASNCSRRRVGVASAPLQARDDAFTADG